MSALSDLASQNGNGVSSKIISKSTSEVEKDEIPFWYIAEHDTSRRDANATTLLDAAQDLGYDMVTIPITTSAFHNYVYETTRQAIERLSSQEVLLQPLSAEHTTLSPSESSSRLVGIVSPWISLGARNKHIARASRQVLKMELAYAAFCGITNVIVNCPTQSAEDVNIYARCILEGLAAGPYLNIRLLFPMVGELQALDSLEGSLLELDESAQGDAEVDISEFAAWQDWHVVRTLCNYNSRLGVALEIPRELHTISSAIKDRWYSEPVKLISFPRISFLRNAKGYPVLHKAHQSYLTCLQRLRFPPWIILSDVTDPKLSTSATSEPTPAEATNKIKSRASHLQYIRHLQQTQPPRPPIERFGQGYQDYMQWPLQPLTDNLESITYEVFEKDRVKYDQYEEATRLALLDLKWLNNSRSVNVAVVGSGRGPLVSRALLASKSSGVKIRCWAVEKNPNAFVHLLKRNKTDELWNGQVTVVKTDMRAWQGPVVDGKLEKLDLMISELLGSFADNELSPECLDGVQHVLDPQHGISIPQDYSAHMTPISTPRLHNDLLTRPGADKFEVPVVVMLQQYDFLSCLQNEPDVQEAWRFDHPIDQDILQRAKARAGGNVDYGGPGGAHGGDGSNEHNLRSCELRFRSQHTGVCHGIAGYFESVLYRNKDGVAVELSTHPLTIDQKSKDMISWFPIFFPLKTPLQIPSGSDIIVTMWRMTDDRKVWYEWFVQVFSDSSRPALSGMSELHSSRANGCLM